MHLASSAKACDGDSRSRRPPVSAAEKGGEWVTRVAHLGQPHAEVGLREVQEAAAGAHGAVVAGEGEEEAGAERVSVDGAHGVAVQHQNAR